MPEPELRDPTTLRVSVLVDLLHRPDAGGHVKAWEKLAAAAAGVAGLDLTVHFAGAAPALRRLADNVRYRLHRPALSTARLPFLSHVPDHTDLAPHHASLARHLADADLLHTTDAYFAFAHTAERVARRDGLPLVSSVHTNTPSYTGLLTAETVERLWGGGCSRTSASAPPRWCRAGKSWSRSSARSPPGGWASCGGGSIAISSPRPAAIAAGWRRCSASRPIACWSCSSAAAIGGRTCRRWSRRSTA